MDEAEEIRLWLASAAQPAKKIDSEGLVNFGTVSQPDRRPPDGSPRNWATHPPSSLDQTYD